MADKKWAWKTDLSRQEILKLVRLLISAPYFQCELGFFKQAKGTPMGGPLSRLLADLIIENKIEAKISANRRWKKSFNWVRLIDDTFMNWTDTEASLDEFFVYLNSLYPPIKWTIEKEGDDGRFNIFDIQLIRNKDKVDTTVYRKPSASDRYLHFSSAQAWHEKVAAIHTLTLRALNYCSTKELLDLEIAYIKQVFLDNGYPLPAIQRIIDMKSHTHEAATMEQLDEEFVDETRIDFAKSFYAPYHPQARKLFDALRKQFNINSVYKKTTTLGNLLFKRRPKKDLWNQSHVVYSVPCEVPPDKYIGQTKRKLKVRIREHERSCEGDLSGIQPNMTNDNGIPIHCASTGHKFLFEQTKILAREPNNFRRRVIEGIHIYNKRDSCVNLIAGLEIDKSWSPILKELVLR